jgi:thymidylate kinase
MATSLRKNQKQLIVLEGVDGVGKTTFARLLALELGLEYDNAPSNSFPFLRQLGKKKEVQHFESWTNKEGTFVSSFWSRQMAHALSHNLSYDEFRFRTLNDNNFKGKVFDRWWYSNYAYGKAFHAEHSYEFDFGLLMDIEQRANKPLEPDIFILVTSKNSPVEEDKTETFEVKKMKKIVAQNFLDMYNSVKGFEEAKGDMPVPKTACIHFDTDFNKSIKQNFADLLLQVKENI